MVFNVGSVWNHRVINMYVDFSTAGLAKHSPDTVVGPELQIQRGL